MIEWVSGASPGGRTCGTPGKPRGERARQVFVGTSPREEAKELGGRGPERAVSLSHLKGSEAASAGVKRRANAAALPHASFRRTPLIREAIGSDAGACLPLAAVAAAIAREREEGGGEWGGIRCTTRARDRVW